MVRDMKRGYIGRVHTLSCEDNNELSLSRLGGTLRRLRQQPEILCEYDNVIKDQMQREIVEDIPQMNQASLGKVHYLPHSGL